MLRCGGGAAQMSGESIRSVGHPIPSRNFILILGWPVSHENIMLPMGNIFAHV